MDGEGSLRIVSFYNGSGKKSKKIDVDKTHKEIFPHVHECDSKQSIPIPGARSLTIKERNKLGKIIEHFNMQ